MENAPEIFWGFDELYLEGMQIGCNGAVGSSYNFAAPIYHRVLDARSSGNTDEAAQWQARAAKSIELITSFGYLPAAKKIMQWIGVDCGAGVAAAGQPLRSTTGLAPVGVGLGRFFRVDR